MTRLAEAGESGWPAQAAMALRATMLGVVLLLIIAFIERLMAMKPRLW